MKPKYDWDYMLDLFMLLDWEISEDKNGITHVKLRKEDKIK